MSAAVTFGDSVDLESVEFPEQHISVISIDEKRSNRNMNYGYCGIFKLGKDNGFLLILLDE